tara:strand:- start:429 stop:722 length:294 start_codon:yes stop_codon:yes gene_type:complete
VKKLSSIRVLDKKVKILYDSKMEDWGQCDLDKKEITLSSRCLKDSEQHWWTLVHEVTHLIFEMTGVAFIERNDEEAYVRCTENLVIPWVLKHLHLRG